MYSFPNYFFLNIKSADVQFFMAYIHAHNLEGSLSKHSQDKTYVRVNLEKLYQTLFAFDKK